MQNVCEPALSAEPRTFRVSGIAITAPSARMEDVFRRLVSPRARLATLFPVTNVLDTWRESSLLASKFRATVLGWPVEAVLRPGLELGKKDGMPTWRAEHAVNGLLHHEAYFVETASWILAENSGAVLTLPGGKRALIVAEEDYFDSIRIGEPIYYSELETSGVMEAVPAQAPGANRM